MSDHDPDQASGGAGLRLGLGVLAAVIVGALVLATLPDYWRCMNREGWFSPFAKYRCTREAWFS